MNIGALIVLAAIGVLLAISAVNYRRGSRQKDTRDPGEAIMEFARAYPDEAIRSVAMTIDGTACFLRLADGKVGFLQAMGRHYVARLILPGTATILPLEDEPGLRVAFDDSTLKDGNYIFKDNGEAAEVSLWLCGSFALASPPMEGPDEGHNVT